MIRGSLILPIKLKTIGKDYLLTLLSAVVSTGILQLVVYPVLGWKFDSETFGVILAATGLQNIIVVSFGNTLCNTRLIHESQLLEQGLGRGDFTSLLLVSASFAGIISGVIGYTYMSLDIPIALLLAVSVFIGIIAHYSLAGCRLNKDFVGNFLAYCFSGVGYLIGIGLACLTELWLLPFVMAEGALFLVSLRSKNLRLSDVERTSSFKRICKTYSMLVSSNLISYLATYFDRLFLLPVLGATAVSTFYVASYFGKAFTFLSAPITTLILSYLSDKSFRMTQKKYISANILVAICGVGMFLVVAVFSQPITSLLYPTLVDSASDYMLIGNAAAILNVVNAMNAALLLKCAPTTWQVVLASLKLIIYFAVGSFAIAAFSLWGYCVVVLLGNAAVLILTFLLGLHYVSDKGEAATGSGV